MTKLYNIFTNCDCTLIKINPFAEITYDNENFNNKNKNNNNNNKKGEMVYVDATVQFDENASL